MLIPSFVSRPEEAPSERVLFGPTRLVFRVLPNGFGKSAILQPSPHPPPQEGDRETLALRGQCVLVIVGEYKVYRRFNESPECSTCNLGINYPRRNLFAPFRR